MKLIGKPLTAALAVTAAAAIVLAPMALASAPGSAARTAPIPPACGNAHPALPDGAFIWGSPQGDGPVGAPDTSWKSPTRAATPAPCAVLRASQLEAAGA